MGRGPSGQFPQLKYRPATRGPVPALQVPTPPDRVAPNTFPEELNHAILLEGKFEGTVFCAAKRLPVNQSVKLKIG
jgi:hypothetical protein